MSIQQGDYLKKLRTENNLSQEKLAEMLDLSRQSISKWEQGYASPDTENLLKLSKIYNISVDTILNCGENIGEQVPKNVEIVDEKKEEKTEIKENKKARVKKKRGWIFFTCPWLAVICTIVVGTVFDGWLYSWMFLLIIPVFYTGIFAIEKKNPLIFCYPVFLLLPYLAGGFLLHLWHPLWLIFLTIPIYYIAAAVNRKNRKIKK